MALIGRGISNAEACRIVGVNRRTGTRWSHGRVVRGADGVVREYGPVNAPAARPLSDRYLSAAERTAIADGVRAGEGIHGIAAAVGRSPSTVSREVRRHRDPGGRYAPFAAHRMAMKELARPRPRRVQRDPELAAVVQEWLDARWSPVRVCEWLRRRYPERPSWHLAPQALSQALYDPSVALQRTAGSACAPAGPVAGRDAIRTAGPPALPGCSRCRTGRPAPRIAARQGMGRA
jgi:IS30 family transposase